MQEIITWFCMGRKDYIIIIIIGILLGFFCEPLIVLHRRSLKTHVVKSWPRWSQWQSCPWHQIKKAGFPLWSPMLFCIPFQWENFIQQSNYLGVFANFIHSDLLLSLVKRNSISEILLKCDCFYLQNSLDWVLSSSHRCVVVKVAMC